MAEGHSITRNGLAWLTALLVAFTCVFATTQVAWAAEEGDMSDGSQPAQQGQVLQLSRVGTEQVGEQAGQVQGGNQEQAQGAPASAQEQSTAGQEQNAGESQAEQAGQVAQEGEPERQVESTNQDQPAQGNLQQQAAGLAQPQSQASAQAEPLKGASLSVKSHVQGQGTKKAVKAGVGKANRATVGVAGKGLRLESFSIKLNSPYKGGVQYQVYVQNVGWQVVRANGKLAGASGKALRIEAVRIALVGEVSKYYDVSYRVYMQKRKWSGWVANGALAGVAGKRLRVEALQVCLAEKAENVGVAQEGIVGIVYRAHVQGLGDQAWTTGGKIAGTTGKSLRLEKLTMRLCAGMYAGSSIVVKGQVQGKAWSGYVAGSKGVGTKGKGLRLQAFRVKLAGPIADVFDVEYRAHVQGQGWQGWVVNGGIAGAAGKGLRIEAVQIKLVRKGSAHLTEGAYVLSFATNGASEVRTSGSKIAEGAYSKSVKAGKFYLRPELGGYTLQSVSNGKFLAEGGALQAWAGSDAQVWKLSRNGGVQLACKSSGATLSIAGSKGFSFVAVKLVENGAYVFANAAEGAVLDVKGTSYKAGANVQVAKKGKSVSQVFLLKNGKGGWCTIVNGKSFKAVEVAKGSKAAGANVCQANAASAARQEWKPQLTRDGKLMFLNRVSGKLLAVAQSGAAGDNVVSIDGDETAGQKWSLSAWKLSGNAAIDEYVLNLASRNKFNLRKCYDWIIDLPTIAKIDDRIQQGRMNVKTLNSYAIFAVENGKGDCYVNAALLCYAARACGFSADARGGHCLSARGAAAHGWTEVHRNGTTYVCDPAMDRAYPGHKWYMVTYAKAPVYYLL